MGKVYDYITNSEEVLHFSLIDPDPVRQTPRVAALMTKYAENAGTNAIMIGGSTAVNPKYIDDTIRMIKKEVSVPVIIFPGNPAHICSKADALLYMSIHNSKNPFFITGLQARTIRKVKDSGLETISMAYLIIEPGGTAGRISKADLLPRNNPELTANYALSAETFGYKTIYLESGSSSKQGIPEEVIKKTSEKLSIPLIYGGGVNNKNDALKAVNNGADIIVMSTFLEEKIIKDKGSSLEEIINIIH